MYDSFDGEATREITLKSIFKTRSELADAVTALAIHTDHADVQLVVRRDRAPRAQELRRHHP